jgi:hypothetical protein
LIVDIVVRLPIVVGSALEDPLGDLHNQTMTTQIGDKGRRGMAKLITIINVRFDQNVKRTSEPIKCEKKVAMNINLVKSEFYFAPQKWLYLAEDVFIMFDISVSIGLASPAVRSNSRSNLRAVFGKSACFTRRLTQPYPTWKGQD